MSSRLASWLVAACWAVTALGAVAPSALAHAPDAAGAVAMHGDAAADSHWSDGYTLVVLDAGADLHTARRLVQAAGGTVALLLPPRYLTGWISPTLDSRLVGHAGIRSLHRFTDPHAANALLKQDLELPEPSDASERTVQLFFARAARGELDRIATPPGDASTTPEATPEVTPEATNDATDQPPEAWRPDALPRPAISEFDIAANLARQGLLRKSGGAATLAANSDYMTGTVSVTLFFVESNGTGSDADVYDWTAGAEQDAFADAAAGLSWWVSQAKKYSGCWVTFRLQAYFATQDARCSQWREPTLHPSTDYPQAVQQVLGNFGYNVGGHLARAAAFDAAMRIQNKTDWAYSVFAAANPSGPRSFTDGYAAWAYIGGPYVSLLQRSFNWSFKQVFAHETAHMFRACDEYYTPGYGGCTGCAGCSDTGVPNGNCQECNANAVPCMMLSNSFTLCNYTAGQLGWWRTPCTEHDQPAPRLDSADPAELVQGAEADVLLHGDFFAAGEQVDCGPGIDVLTTEVLGETLLRARLRIDVDVAPGTRDIVVLAPDGQDDRLVAGLRIRATPRHYVSAHGTNLFPYDRPERAAIDLATVLAACSAGDTLLLAGGTYAPFTLHKSLVLVGGWADDFGVRAVQANPSIVQGAPGAPAVTLDGAASHPILDGLVLRGGSGAMMATAQLGNVPAGGGILCLDAAPTLRNCTLENNAAGTPGSPGAGGGAFFWRATPRLENCIVRGNSAAKGGGLFFLESTATLAGNTIEANDAAGSGHGAGLAAVASRITLDGDRIAGNLGALDGGGLHFESCPRVTLAHVVCDANSASRDGGGIESQASRLELRGCRITRNTAGRHGGGVQATGDSLQLDATVVAANHAATLGGGLDLDACLAHLDNVTIAGNDGGAASGIFWGGAASPGRLRSSILADNVGGGILVASGVAPLLDWNLFWQNAGLDRLGADAGSHDITADPLFAAAATLDFRLGLESPGLDSGDPDPSRLDPDASPNDRGAHGGPMAWPAAPARVEGLVALALGGDNRLQWHPSTDAAIATYVVYRDSIPDGAPTAAHRVVTLPAPTTVWIDTEAPAGAWYRVVAVDAAGHASGASTSLQPSPPSDAALHAPAFALHRIAPNPANPGAWIEFELPAAAPGTLAIYDSRGRRVRELASGTFASGTRRVYWDGRDDTGRPTASGVYWVRLAAGAAQRTAKLVVVR